MKERLTWNAVLDVEDETEKPMRITVANIQTAFQVLGLKVSVPVSVNGHWVIHFDLNEILDRTGR